ncbi:MAG: bifunctional tetrahydrofolate synthase/dihydrofolate synthase [gamma proteobacterium symbiont of Bathyaustriella thionipta]|nr:bifunctional tetrahydrofolate synthase/dihydrofolate synthase [gamma proteobacterium symbiont of Bathyaustriella thionipta]MCU7950064.1 bifunctional tetrahydrofolate synthase/dihydrofolate synthase [gamma proteobacterium symbiont of Bathyaustriella thionipta]MCU7952549.1 bifunctional tetrahydrofolate synthase/dihydrofolate synthase [gamma proteobacterium symbiont of Bathyaustriella thionipta]MCU7957038.1 bifunctional tetrahydrofolate synthase/dihydrofolate synthase [gamma proteobacterium symb
MPKTLQDWLNWQETLHPSEIDMGLERVAQVVKKLLPDCYESSQCNLPFTVITVAGTNGKGSTVAMLEAILCEAGYRVGSYTSPHLLHYNERIKINQTPVDEQLICDSFERIDHARGELSLTYFEFGTLAAIDIIHHQLCDIAVLEVGLGGRLDAVNVIDPDIALVTTVDIDHQDWLGDNRNAIGLEKAGIYRKHKPALYGDSDLPESIEKLVIEQGLTFFQFSVDYHYTLRDQNSAAQTPEQKFNSLNSEVNINQWGWLAANNLRHFNSRYNLPSPNLKGSAQFKNASNVLMVLELLKYQFPVTQAEIKRGLQNVQLSGRFQIMSTDPLVILDVAHNVQAAKILKQSCEHLGSSNKLNVIVGMLKDKDVTEVITILEPIVDSWRIIELDSPRAMPAAELEMIIKRIARNKMNQVLPASKPNTQTFDNFDLAYEDFAKSNALMGNIEPLLVFGSFFTVTDALQSLEHRKQS